MSKRVIAMAVVCTAVLAGCANEPGTPTPAPEQAQGSPSKRTAPAKSLVSADACAVVTEPQRQQLGADQPPRVRDVLGKQACHYQHGMAGAGGWAVAVAVDSTQTMGDFARQRGSLGTPLEIAGYPAVQVPTAKNCLMSVDIADRGSLYLNTLSASGTPRPCELSKQFAEAALQNLPNA